jgi:hypothetical protein
LATISFGVPSQMSTSYNVDVQGQILIETRWG